MYTIQLPSVEFDEKSLRVCELYADGRTDRHGADNRCISAMCHRKR